jgi:hypothetical protein
MKYSSSLFLILLHEILAILDLETHEKDVFVLDENLAVVIKTDAIKTSF